MITKTTGKKSLRGLGSLSKTFSSKLEKDEGDQVQEVSYVSIDRIKEDPQNVRRKYNESSLNDFADVIKVVGISSPLVVRNNLDTSDGFEYIIYNGHRRYRAAKIAGLTEVPITLNNKFNILLQLSDNLVSEDLDLLDTAEAIHTILTSEDPAVKRTREDVAKGISKSPTWISKILRIRSMPDSIKSYYDSGRITDLDAIYQLTVNYPKFSSKITKWLERYKENSDLILQGAVNTFIKELKKTEKESTQEDSLKEISETCIAPQCFDIDLTSNISKISKNFDSKNDSQDHTTNVLIKGEGVDNNKDDIKQPHELTKNLQLPAISESNLDTSIDTDSSFDNAEMKLTFSFEIKGRSLDESIKISKEIEEFIEERFSNKVILKSKE